MINSILTSTKKNLGILEEYEHFDPELIVYINTVFALLTQLGVGPDEGFQIEDKTAVWTDFITDQKVLNVVKSYMYIRVRMLFDPPTGAVLDALQRTSDEFEYRLNYFVDSGEV